jgi:DNA topoisomerase IB
VDSPYRRPAGLDERLDLPEPRGHIQATGRDARGRKQYRYHFGWRAVRDASKFDRLLNSGRVLSILRERIESDLALPGVPRERILATVTWIIDRTLMRVGNEEYARANDSYGATTLRKDHVEIMGAEVVLSFRGKHGKEHRADFRDRRIAAILRRCHDSGDVNDYLREIAVARSRSRTSARGAGPCVASASCATPACRARHVRRRA